MNIPLKQSVILVDGSYYLFRSYHALPSLHNSRGEPTGAIYGFINMLRKLLKDHDPEYIAIVFDCQKKTFRHKIYPQYKANRDVMPKELKIQIEPIFNIITYMGVPLIKIPGVEADDIIGTLAIKAKIQEFNVMIYTGDKDMAQLVSNDITCINSMTNEVLDIKGVVDKFKVRPEQICDYLTLTGDYVDNIPGIYKVGPKTAIKWLKKYNNLDTIIKNSDQILGKVGENLRTALSDLPLYKKLITINTNINLNQNLQNLKCKPAKNQELHKLFNQLEFKNWIKPLDYSGGIEKIDYEIVLNNIDLNRWIQKLEQAHYFVFNVETNTSHYMNEQLIGICFATEQGKAVYIPIAHTYKNVPKQLSKTIVLAAIYKLLTNKKILKICHNLKYNMEIMENNNIKIDNFNFDTMLASYILSGLSNRKNINMLALENDLYKHKHAKYLSNFDVKYVTKYAVKKANITMQLYKVYISELQKIPSLQHIFYAIEMPLVSVLVAMELRGVLIDKRNLKIQSNTLKEYIVSIQNEAYILTGKKFNLGSPKQLQEILFRNLKLPIKYKTPIGKPTTNEMVLKELAINYDLPRIILKYRSLMKLKTTYTDKLPLVINKKTGRIHTSYNQTLTATGRLSSSNPNLQNIPIKRTNDGIKIRSAFIAPKGYKIVSADYSQIELRIIAHLSNDQTLLNIFKNGQDIHCITASEVFNTPLNHITKEQRRRAKIINFSLIYGISAFGLAKKIGVSLKDSKQYIDNFFTKFPRVKKYMDDTRKLASKQGYVETFCHRRLYLPNIKSNKTTIRKAAERSAINAPLQGTQADIIKIAMISINDWINKYASDMYMIMQVHDELVFEIPVHKIRDYCKKIVDTMRYAVNLKTKLEVNVGIGDTWDEASCYSSRKDINI